MNNDKIRRVARQCGVFLAAALFGCGSWLLSVAVGWSAPAATIVFPPDQALLSGDGSLQVLGYRPEGAAGTISVTGKGAPHSQPVGVGAFSVKVKLVPGPNVIALGDRSVKVFLVGKDPAVPPEGFSPPDTHAVENGCEDCHAISGTGVTLLEKPPALCNRCHDDALKGKDGKPLAVLHPPAEEGDCLACHQFHRLSIKRIPASAKKGICFGCHDDFTGGGKKKMHAPVAKGECTGCHGPHGAAGKKLLPATGVKLCLLCHADPSRAKDGKEFAVPHPALDDGCPSCHLPHVSDAPRLLKKPVAQVCADCHDPFPEAAGGNKFVRHSPVEEGECAACHQVHGSEAKKLLAAQGKALCLKCHDDPTLGPDGKAWAEAHPALDDGCLICHLPHVAPAAGMLKKPQAALCADCHDAFLPPAEGKSGSIHRPVIQGQCAKCHGPHGAPVKKLLRAAPARALCLTCHKDPALDAGGEPFPVAHPALDDGCTACHRPHVADAPRLLAKPQADLCADCHEDKRHDNEGKSWAVVHPPVVKGLCTSCHGPHGSKEKALLVQSSPEVCRTCHVEVHQNHLRAEFDPETGQPLSGVVVLPPGFPVRKKDSAFSCVGCHQPHGSNFKKLWNKDDASFCPTCHSQF